MLENQASTVQLSYSDTTHVELTNKRILLTGGAGFIGSHLAQLLQSLNNKVVVADNCSGGNENWVPDEAELVRADLADKTDVAEVVTSDLDFVFHLASRKSVNDDNPQIQFNANTKMVYNVIDRMRDVGVTNICYTSSSTVYGEAPLPTPESYGPAEPISVYGASKLANEGLISTYAHSHGFNAWTFRFANIVGPRLRGAVIPDFIEKLQENPDSLTILGDGCQQKSYMHISDCVEAMIHIIENDASQHSIYNLGTETTTSVTEIADIVCEVLNVDPEYEYTGGSRGWTGDVRKMRLETEKLHSSGWEPSLESSEAVRRAARELVGEIVDDADESPTHVENPP